MRLPANVVILFLLSRLSVQPACGQDPTAPEFRVSIVAVTQFEDPQLQEDQQLNAANDKAARALADYFQKSFHITADLFTVAAETTTEFLRTWLFKDLPLDSRKAVHLIFVLTHGFADKTPPVAGGQSELFLATADTHAEKYLGKAIPGSDFIAAFKRMSPRATIFLFIDSCGSGAIDSTNLGATELTLDPRFASRIMIVAAANADESAYGARFTNTLMRVWQTKNPPLHCGARKIADFLTASLKESPDVSRDVKQTVRVVAELSPEFCIENFAFGERSLLLYNASPGDVTVTLQADDESEPEPPKTLRKDEMYPWNLKAKAYTIVAKRDPVFGSDSNQVKGIDLKSEPAKVEVLFSEDPLDKLEASQAAVQYLDSRDVFPTVSAELKWSGAQIISRLSSSINERLRAIDGEEGSLVAVARAEVANVESAKTRADRALQERDSAENQLRACSRPPLLAATCTGMVERVKDADARLRTAMDQYAFLQKDAQQNQLMISNMLLVKAEIVDESVRLARLQEAQSDIDARRAQAEHVVTEVINQLKAVYPNVQRTNRGVVLALDDPGEHGSWPAWLGKFVGIVNKFPDVHIEIELLRRGDGSIAEQLQIRQRAAVVRNRIQQMGLASSNVAARGFISSKATALTRVNIIVSPP